MESLREISNGELSVVCSNLSKACAKQLRAREGILFAQLSDFYREKGLAPDENHQIQDLLPLILQDLQEYPKAKEQALFEGDRGSMRALVWGEKVSKLLKALLARQEKQHDALLENTNVYVCEVCGFVTVAGTPPESCPICKAPRTRFSPIQREV